MLQAREAVNGVEGLAKIVCNTPNETLGDCIKLLRQTKRLDGARAKGLESLRGFASAHFRHGASVVRPLTSQETEYVIQDSKAAMTLLLSLDATAA